MPDIRKEHAKLRESSGGGFSYSGPYHGQGRDFDSMYSVIRDKDEVENGERYAWMERARAAEGSRKEHLDKINQPRDVDERAVGRRNWNGTDRQEMTGADKFVAGLGSVAEGFSISADNDFLGNLAGATIGSLLSPVTAFGSAAQNAYEAVTGRPVSEADDDLDTMPDYELNANEKTAAGLNATIDVLGLGFGGSKDYIESLGRTARYNSLMTLGKTDEAAKVANAAQELVPTSLAHGARMIGGSMLEEGGEEALQAGLEEIRYDQVDDGSLGRIMESAAWGAVGGATMKGASMGLNYYSSRGATKNQASSNATAVPAGSVGNTGDPGYDYYVKAVDARGMADADIQEEANKQRDKGNASPMSGAAKLVQGRPDMSPVEAEIGARTIRKAYLKDDSSKDEFLRAMNEAGRRQLGDQWAEMTKEQVDDVFLHADDATLAAWINDFLDRDNFDFDVYLKRDPHARDSAVMRFRLKHVNEGNSIMTNTMIPQMFGGDIDGDMLGFLVDPDVIATARYAPAYFMLPRPLPVQEDTGDMSGERVGDRSSFGEVSFDPDFIGLTLDRDLLTNAGLIGGNVNEILAAVNDSFGSLPGVSVSEIYSTLMDAWARDKKSGGKGKHFARALMNVRDGIIRTLNDKSNGWQNPTYANQAKVSAADVTDFAMSDLILRLQQKTSDVLMFDRMLETTGATPDIILPAIPKVDIRNANTSRGTTGVYQKGISIYAAMNALDTMFDSNKNVGLRFKQNMVWKATTTRMIAEQMARLSETELDMAVQAMIHILATDQTPIKQTQSLFRAYVANSVINSDAFKYKMCDERFNLDAAIDTFVEVYNDYAEKYNKALKREGFTDKDVLLDPVKKGEILSGDISSVRAFNEVFGNFLASELFGAELDGAGTVSDVIEMISDNNTTVQVQNMLSVAAQNDDVNKFVNYMANEYGSREYARGKDFEDLIDSFDIVEEITWDDNGNAHFDEMARPSINNAWEVMKNVIGIQECYAYGLVNLDSAINSRFGRALFGKDKDARKNVVLELKLGYGTRGYLLHRSKMVSIQSRINRVDEIIQKAWDHLSDAQKKARGEDWVQRRIAASKKNLKAAAAKHRMMAVQFMRSYFGSSYLHDQVADLVINHSDDSDPEGIGDLNDEMLMRMLNESVPYAEKKRFFMESQSSRPKGAARDNLMENASRNTGEELADGKFSNQLTKAKNSLKKYNNLNVDAARKMYKSLAGLPDNGRYSEEDLRVALMHQMMYARQKISSIMFAAQVWDAADVLKQQIDKGTSTPNETVLFQALSNRYNGGVKSAMNRITGDTMNSGMLSQMARSKRDILSVLSDPTANIRVDFDDGSGYKVITRDILFKDMGIELAHGAEPSWAQWMKFFSKCPNVLTWLCDTTFDPVAGGDSVVETMAGDLGANLKRYLDHGSRDERYDYEVEQIEYDIQDDPRNVSIVIGMIGAEYEGERFNTLLESPKKFARVYSEKLRQLAKFEHYRLSGTSSDTSDADMRGLIEEASKSALGEQIERLVSRIWQQRYELGTMIESIAPQIADDVYTLVEIETYGPKILESLRDGGKISKKQYKAMCKAMKAYSKSKTKGDNVLDEGMDLVDEQIYRVIAVTRIIDPSYEHGALIGTEALNVIRGWVVNNVDSSDVNSVNDAIDSYNRDIHAEKSIADSIQAALNDPIVQLAITNNDLTEDGLKEMARKIHEIQSSGKFRYFAKIQSEADIYAELKDVRSGSGGLKKLENIKNRYNGLVLTRIIKDVPGIDPKESGRFISAYDDAVDQLNQMHNMMFERKSKGKLSISTGNYASIPELNFSNETAGILCNFAISGLESAGNSVMSGVEGGEYKNLIALAMYDRKVSFGTGPSLVRVGDIRNQKDQDLVEVAFRGAKYSLNVVDSQQYAKLSNAANGAPINAPANTPFRNNFGRSASGFKKTVNGNTQDLTFDELDNDDYIWMYRMDDTPHPDMDHMPVSPIRNGKPMNYLTELLLNIVWNRNEPGVFQRKKIVGAFDNVVRDMMEDEDLARGTVSTPIDKSSPEGFSNSVKNAVLDYRRRLGEFYYEQFKLEKMDDKFGKYDAYLIAQLTTPFVVVEMNDDTRLQFNMSDVWKMTIGANIDVAQVKTVKMVPMSLGAVTNKLLKGMVRRNLAPMSNGRHHVSRSQLRESFAEEMFDWSNYQDLGREGTIRYLGSIPALSRTVDVPRQVTGRGPYVPAQFLDLVDGTHRGSVGGGPVELRGREQIDADNAEVVRGVNEGAMDITAVGHDKRAVIHLKDHPIVGGFADMDRVKGLVGSVFTNMRSNDGSDSVIDAIQSLVGLGGSKHSFNGKMIDARATSIISIRDSVDGYMGDIASMQADNGLSRSSGFVLIPSDDIDSVRAKMQGLTVVGGIKLLGIEFSVVDPGYDKRLNEFLGPVTPVDLISRDELRTSVAIAGKTSDSPVMTNPNSKAPTTRVDAGFAMDRGILFSGMRGQLEMPDGPSDLAEFRKQFQAYLDDSKNGTHTSKLVMPKFPPGNTSLTEDVMVAAVEGYLGSASSYANDVNRPCFASSNVQLGQCIGFVKMRTNEASVSDDGVYYAPVILNKGGIPATIDFVSCGIDPDNADGLQLRLFGNLTATECEGIKVAFSAAAFKAYARVATQKEWDEIGLSLGVNLNVDGRSVDIDEVYPLDTEESRLVDRNMTTFRENLYFGNLLTGGGLFVTYDVNNKPVRDYAKAREHGWSESELDDLLNMHQMKGVWYKIARGEKVLLNSEVAERDGLDAKAINRAVRLVAARVIQMNQSPFIETDASFTPAQFMSSLSWEVGPDKQIVPMTHLLAPDSIDDIFGCIEDPDTTLKLFNFINPRLCPPGYSASGAATDTLLDQRGYIRVKDRNGKAYYAPGHIQSTRVKHDATTLGIPSQKNSVGNQQIINSILENGISDAKALQSAIDIMMISSGYYTDYTLGGRYYTVETPDVNPNKVTKVDRQIWGKTSMDFGYDEEVASEGYDTFRRPLTIVDSTHDDSIVDPNTDLEIQAAIQRLIGPDGARFDVEDSGAPSMLYIHNLVKCATGYSRNDGLGSQKITKDQFLKALNVITTRFSQGKFPIQGGYVNNRYTLPLMPSYMMRYTWKHSRQIQDSNISYKDFVDMALNEMKVSDEQIALINDTMKGGKARKRALQTISEYLYRDNGLGHESPNLWWGYGEEQMVKANYRIYQCLSDTTPGYQTTEEQRREEMAQRIKVIKELRDSDKYEKTSAPGAPNGWVATWFGRHRTWYDYVCKNMVLASRTNAMLHPFLIPSSVLARAKGYGMSRAMLFFRNGRKQDYAIRDQGALRSACKNQDARELWITLNELSMNSDDVDAAVNAGSYQAILEYARRERDRGGRLKKISRGVFKTMTADGALTSQQIEIFVNEFSLAIRELGDASMWNRKLDNGMTELERAVQTDLPNFMAMVLSMRPDNPDFDIAQRARNVALQMDMAQRDAKSMVISEFFKRHSFCELMVVTHFMRFHQYVFNSNNWFLGHVAPSMAINWWFNDMLIRKSRSENPMLFGIDLRALNLESGQMHMNFQQACTYDVINMGISWVTSLILAGLLDFEPPKDDEGNIDLNRIGNLNEWTILGMRVDVPWWLQDVLGPSLAMAAFAKSAWIGEPRLDILSNWFAQAMWNNPALRAADFVSTLFAPAGDELDGMVEQAELYADAKGGSPSLMQMWGTGALTYGLNWASQFITPSIVKEVYRTMPQYEHTYKRIYVRDENGNIVTDENGMPYTTLTTYEDQMKRRLSRQNPFLAFLFNLTNDTGTGYFTWEMPTTTYYQNDQLASVQYYSMYYTDENGVQQAKSADEINAMAFEIISVLQAEDDLDELAASGWVLPYDTRVYVSKLLWDQVHYLDNLWSEWVENEAYDFEVLGNGDFGAGRKQYEEAKQAYNQDRQNLMDVYNKLWDESLSHGITKYNRYNTTYQQDAEGNWYATGFRRGIIMNTAPGSTTDPGPTLGQYGNWETPAYRNPEISAGGRALIPIDEAYLETPSISSWSEDGGGDGYSDMVALTVGALAGNEYEPNGDSDRPSYRLYYGGGYGYGGGGGGGGGYRPKIYSNLPHVSMPYADSMYAERLYDPNYDYLRPNFETKGSREAYKRSDI